MNRTRWAVFAAVTALLAVLVGAALVWNVVRMAGPASPGVREAFAFDAAYADPDPLVLVVRYGDSSSCPSLAVRQNKLVRIPLTAPLGSREVVDGSRSVPVPITTDSPPFG